MHQLKLNSAGFSIPSHFIKKCNTFCILSFPKLFELTIELLKLITLSFIIWGKKPKNSCTLTVFICNSTYIHILERIFTGSFQISAPSLLIIGEISVVFNSLVFAYKLSCCEMEIGSSLLSSTFTLCDKKVFTNLIFNRHAIFYEILVSSDQFVIFKPHSYETIGFDGKDSFASRLIR